MSTAEEIVTIRQRAHYSDMPQQKYSEAYINGSGLVVELDTFNTYGFGEHIFEAFTAKYHPNGVKVLQDFFRVEPNARSERINAFKESIIKAATVPQLQGQKLSFLMDNTAADAIQEVFPIGSVFSYQKGEIDLQDYSDWVDGQYVAIDLSYFNKQEEA